MNRLAVAIVTFILISFHVILSGGVWYIFQLANPKKDCCNPIKIIRNSNHTDGISILDNLEKRNLLNEARRINSSNNRYLNETNWHTIINQSTTEYYNDTISEDRGQALYVAYVWSFKAQRLTNELVSRLIVETIDDFLFFPLHEENDIPMVETHWTYTDIVDEVQFNSGWLAFQRIESGNIHGPLDGEGKEIKQIIILSQQEILLWMGTSVSHWIV